MTNIANGVTFHEPSGVLPTDAARWASLDGYCEMLSEAYGALTSQEGDGSVRSVIVDASCGVGGRQLPNVIAKLNDQKSHPKCAEDNESTKKAKVMHPLIQIQLLNNVGEGALNEGCGAEFVQKGRRPPIGWEGNAGEWTAQRLCSFDGDGDRLVYHFFDEHGTRI